MNHYIDHAQCLLILQIFCIKFHMISAFYIRRKRRVQILAKCNQNDTIGHDVIRKLWLHDALFVFDSSSFFLLLFFQLKLQNNNLMSHCYILISFLPGINTNSSIWYLPHWNSFSYSNRNLKNVLLWFSNPRYCYQYYWHDLCWIFSIKLDT